jgi:surfactin synthase thioesterase subunit
VNLSKQREVHFVQISGHKTISELAADVLNNAPPVFALAGLSMGGIVAMEVLSQAAERVER